MQIACYYPATKRRPSALDIHNIEDGRRHPVSIHEGLTKTEARNVALALGATWWN